MQVLALLCSLAFIIFLGCAAFFPITVLVNHPEPLIKFPHVAESSLAVVIKRVFVFDESSYSNKQSSLFDFAKDRFFITPRRVQESPTLDGRRVWSNHIRQRVYWEHYGLPQFRFIYVFLRSFISNAPRLADISSSCAVNAYRKINGVVSTLLHDQVQRFQINSQSSPFFAYEYLNVILRDLDGSSSFVGLPADKTERRKTNENEPPFGPFDGCVPLWRVIVGFFGMCFGAFVIYKSNSGRRFLLGLLLIYIASLIWLTGHYDCEESQAEHYGRCFQAALLQNTGSIPNSCVS